MSHKHLRYLYFLDVNLGKLPSTTPYLEKWSNLSLWKVNTTTLTIVSFLIPINEMLQSFALEKCNPVRPFNPTILQCDERISNYTEIEAVFGRTLFEKITASCEFTFIKA